MYSVLTSLPDHSTGQEMWIKYFCTIQPEMMLSALGVHLNPYLILLHPFAAVKELWAAAWLAGFVQQSSQCHHQRLLDSVKDRFGERRVQQSSLINTISGLQGL